MHIFAQQGGNFTVLQSKYERFCRGLRLNLAVFTIFYFCLIGILLQYELPVSPSDLLPVCLIHFRCMCDRHLLRCPKNRMDNPCIPICDLDVHILTQSELWIHFVQEDDTSECCIESTCRIQLQVFQFFLLFQLSLQFWVLRLPVDVLTSSLLAMSYWNRSQWNSWDNQWQQQAVSSTSASVFESAREFTIKLAQHESMLG